jgi:hypothetical protein
MSPQPDFPIVFEKLKAILKPYAKNLNVTADTPTGYSLDGAYSDKYNRAIFYGAVQIKKNYVSFYLMPVYMFPELLKGMSPELKKHMQGKSCFNFKKVEPELFKELKALTRLSVDRAHKAKASGEI